MFSPLLGLKLAHFGPIVFASLAVFALGFTGGYTYAWSRQEATIQKLHKQEAQRRAAAVEAALKQERAQAAITAKADQAAVVVQEKIRTVYRTIEKKVTVYVTPKADASCTVPRGFVRLHDAAAKGEPLPDPASDVDAPSGVALSVAGSTVAANYGACRETAERLSGLQSWVREQEALRP